MSPLTLQLLLGLAFKICSYLNKQTKTNEKKSVKWKAHAVTEWKMKTWLPLPIHLNAIVYTPKLSGILPHLPVRLQKVKGVAWRHSDTSKVR